MWSITLTSLLLFTFGASAAELPAVAVRPDWTNAPQGQRILPRINDTAPLDGAKRKEIVYGPYSLGGGNMLSKFNLMAQAPCDDCFVTAIQATARYASGKEVMTSDGVWLHHAVLMSISRSRSSTPLGSTVIWAGGNERPTVRLNTRYKYGIDWPGSFSILVEFMSEIEQNTKVSLAITYEYIEKSNPQSQGYRDVYMRWNSVGTPDPQPGKYNFESSTWTVPMSGVLLQAAGHMHDGGTSVDLYINDQKACSSQMYYGSRAGYGSPAAQQHSGHAGQMSGPQQPNNAQQANSPRPANPQPYNPQQPNPQSYAPRPANPQINNPQQQSYQPKTPQGYNAQPSNQQSYNPQPSTQQSNRPQPANQQSYNPQPSNQQTYNSQQPNFQQNNNAQPWNSQQPYYHPQPASNPQPYNNQPYNNQPYNNQPYNNQPYNSQPYNGPQPNNARPGDEQERLEAGRATTLPWNNNAPANGVVRRDGPHGGFGGQHISDPGHCTNFGRVKEGDKMRIVANYDSSQHQAMTHQGDAEALMGNMRVWIGPDEE